MNVYEVIYIAALVLFIWWALSDAEDDEPIEQEERSTQDVSA